MPEFTEPRRRKPKPAKPPKPPREKKTKAAKKPKLKVQSVQRAQNVQKPPKPRKPRQRRRKNLMIYYVMFFIAGVTLFATLAGTVLFNLEEVVIEGESIYSSGQIIAVSGIRRGVNLLRFDTEGCRRNIIDSLVYIDDVTVRRTFPNKVSITVHGAVEMAGIEHEGLFYTISRNGRILETNRSYEDRGNVIIYGFEADEPIVGGYISSAEFRKTGLVFTLIETAENAGLTGIVDINITDHLDIWLNYMNRIKLHIGTAADLEQKLRAAVHILENDIESNEQGTLILLDPLKVVFSPE
jgi:cell division protein FtsQ